MKEPAHLTNEPGARRQLERSATTINATRGTQIKLQAGIWYNQAVKQGLLVPDQPAVRNRSMADCGVSIDWLTAVAHSIRDQPLLPTSTQAVVNHLVNAATSERQCRMVDIIPPEHTGTATLVISHAWTGDFLELVAAITEEFEHRWEAAQEYKRQKKGEPSFKFLPKEESSTAVSWDLGDGSSTAREAVHWTPQSNCPGGSLEDEASFGTNLNDDEEDGDGDRPKFGHWGQDMCSGQVSLAGRQCTEEAGRHAHGAAAATATGHASPSRQGTPPSGSANSNAVTDDAAVRSSKGSVSMGHGHARFLGVSDSAAQRDGGGQVEAGSPVPRLPLEGESSGLARGSLTGAAPIAGRGSTGGAVGGTGSTVGGRAGASPSPSRMSVTLPDISQPVGGPSASFRNRQGTGEPDDGGAGVQRTASGLGHQSFKAQHQPEHGALNRRPPSLRVPEGSSPPDSARSRAVAAVHTSLEVRASVGSVHTSGSRTSSYGGQWQEHPCGSPTPSYSGTSPGAASMRQRDLRGSRDLNASRADLKRTSSRGDLGRSLSRNLSRANSRVLSRATSKKDDNLQPHGSLVSQVSIRSRVTVDLGPEKITRANRKVIAAAQVTPAGLSAAKAAGGQVGLAPRTSIGRKNKGQPQVAEVGGGGDGADVPSPIQTSASLPASPSHPLARSTSVAAARSPTGTFFARSPTRRTTTNGSASEPPSPPVGSYMRTAFSSGPSPASPSRPSPTLAQSGGADGGSGGVLPSVFLTRNTTLIKREGGGKLVGRNGDRGPGGAGPGVSFAAVDSSSSPRARRKLKRSGKSLYDRASENVGDLTALLVPDGEEAEGEEGAESEVLQQVMEDMRVRAERKARDVEAARAQAAAVQKERSRMMGYYLWIDVFALPQFAAVPRAVSLDAMSRLLLVVGRTALVVDEDCRALRRAWCVWEVWATLRHKRSLFTLTTPSARYSVASPRHVGSGSGSLGDRGSTQGLPASQAGSNSGKGQKPGSAGPAQGSAQAVLGTDGAAVLTSLGLDLNELFGEEEQGPTGWVVPELDLAGCRAARAEDKAAVMGVWLAEVASPKNQVGDLASLGAELRSAIQDAHDRESSRTTLVEELYCVLRGCGRAWRGDALPGEVAVWGDVEAVRRRLVALAQEHFPAGLARSKAVAAVAGRDSELEAWQLLLLAADELDKLRYDSAWAAELRRFAEAAHRSFASRFSTSYVDGLLRAAGTFDDMKVLRSYVYSRCRTKLVSERPDTVGLGDSDEEEGDGDGGGGEGGNPDRGVDQ